MTPSSTNYSPNQFNFGSIKGKKVIADFTGGRITSDAGIVLLAELDRKLTAWLDMLGFPQHPPRYKSLLNLRNVFKITEIQLIQIIQFINYWHKEFMVLF